MELLFGSTAPPTIRLASLAVNIAHPFKVDSSLAAPANRSCPVDR